MGPGSGTHMQPKLRKPATESQAGESAAGDTHSRRGE
jgi:hypothetical protein